MSSHILGTLTERQTIQDDDRNAPESVILIDSDQEDDLVASRDSRPIRLVPDRRRSRPRDAMNRFLDANGTNVAIQQTSQDASEAGYDPDDIAIVREVSHSADYSGPIDPNAEFVDLDEEPEYIGNEPSTILINGSRNRGTDGANDDDDGIEIIQERTRAPRVTLNLPGGETLEINASPTDRPIRRSFEWQRNLRQSRRQMLRRSARRARQMLFEPEEEEGDGTEHNESGIRLPPNVLLYRQQEQLRQRQSQSRARHEHSESGSNRDINDPALDELRRRIDSHPPDVRSAFEHAQSLHEFRSILQNVAPVTLQECDSELIPLFTEYRSRIVERWAEDRVRTSQEEASSNRNAHNQRTLRNRRRHFRIHMGVDGGGFGESLANYIMMNANRTLEGRGEWPTEYDEEDEEARTQSIVNMIQEREEMEHDLRTKKFMEKTKSQQDQIIKRSLELPDDYSASFHTEPKVKMDIIKDGKPETVIVEDFDSASKYEDIPVCCLCGVELGVGIPKTFQGIHKVDRGVSFECLVYKYRFHCPYQSLSKPSQLDRDLSKRTFVASCGHTFCGRCFARIDNARSKSRMAKKKLAELKGSSHPDNYGPKTCPARGCKACLRSRGKMREAFF